MTTGPWLRTLHSSTFWTPPLPTVHGLRAGFWHALAGDGRGGQLPAAIAPGASFKVVLVALATINISIAFLLSLPANCNLQIVGWRALSINGSSLIMCI